VTPSQTERAHRFAELHHRPGEVLVLPNAWDVASAVLLEAAGFPAVATTSAGLAWAWGYRDGEGLPLARLLETVERMAAALTVPLSVDFEAGYGGTPAEIGAAVEAVIAAGAVGINLEDRNFSGRAPLRDLGLQQEVLHAAREAADRTGIHLFLNARTDIYLGQVGEPAGRLAHTIERLQAFATSGADGVFVPALRNPDDIAAVVQEVKAPLNVLALPGVPAVPDLAKLGAARLSLGSGPMRAVYVKLRQIAEELNGPGTFESLAEQIDYAELQRLISRG
jgi:2-methylisocitrate lyase-like PEP mutase family enzyme